MSAQRTAFEEASVDARPRERASVQPAHAGHATARPGGALDAAAVLRLQGAVGNAAVTGLLQRCGAGGCSCGGTCGRGKAGHDEAEEESLRMSRPGDAAELEADRIARRVLAGSTPGIQRVASEGSLPVPSHVEEGVGRLEGRGARLDPSTRIVMERRLGHDLGDVRIHRGPDSAHLTRAVDAEAFTVGSDIFFGPGTYAPGTERGNYVLAHELAHVVQHGSGLSRRTLYRVDPSLCGVKSECRLPDREGISGAVPTRWALGLAVDKEEEGLGRLITGNVGHTWVLLQDDTGAQWSYGLWPQHGFDASQPHKTVAGCIHHPDMAHYPPNATNFLKIPYELTKENFDKALDFAEAECKRDPPYNLFTYNCTTFAIKTAREAGVSPPSSTTLAIHNPNALYEGMEEELEKRKETAEKASGAGSVAGRKTAPAAAPP